MTVAIPSERPHWTDNSPEAGAYRRAELLTAIKGFDGPAWREAERRQRARDRAAYLENRIEELLDEVDRLRAELAGVIAELEHVGTSRSIEDMAAALGYASTLELKRSLARWGRPDLAGVAA